MTAEVIKADIQNAINAGKKVIVSQTEVQYYQWKGVGYVVLDPTTGVGAYMISGGLAGGGTAKVLKDPPITMSKDSLEYKTLKYIFTWVVIGNAISLIDTEYLLGGKDPKTDEGLDCSGLTRYVYSLAGFKIPDGASNQYNYFNQNQMLFQTPQSADLFFFRKNGAINHTGIVAGVSGNTISIIHAVTELPLRLGGEINKVTETTINMDTDTYWQSRIAGFGRVIE